MSRLTDEDGIDGPFERGMRRAMREDAAKQRQVLPVVRDTGWRPSDRTEPSDLRVRDAMEQR